MNCNANPIPQKVMFAGVLEPVEEVVTILQCSSKFKDEYLQRDEIFRWLGRRMGFDQFPAGAAQ